MQLIIGNKNYSSWSLRPWLLMKEARIDFEEHRIVLDTPTTKREIAEFSAAGRVPVICPSSSVTITRGSANPGMKSEIGCRPPIPVAPLVANVASAFFEVQHVPMHVTCPAWIDIYCCQETAS